MKKSIVAIILVGLVGILLTAAVPVPPPNQTLTGTLRWQRASVCGVSDYVPLPVMTNVYLIGNFKPTNGTLQGCHIEAQGTYFKTNTCTYFAVDKFKVVCPLTTSFSTTLSGSDAATFLLSP